MKFLDRFLARWFPEHTMKGLRAQRAVKNLYESAQDTRLHKNKRATGSADAENAGAMVSLRQQARNLEQNFDLAESVLAILEDRIVGPGIYPTPQVKLMNGELAVKTNEALARLHKEWARRPEVTHEHSLASLQRLTVRSKYRDGEIFHQRLMGKVRGLDHGTKVPYSLEPLEADYVPSDYDDDQKGITHGVKKNSWGRPVAYFVYKAHPGDIRGTTMVMPSEVKSVKASKMFHLKLTKRFQQTRGISVFAAVFNRFEDIKEIDETERVAARIAASLAMYIKKGTPELYTAPDTGDTYREIDISPGMTFDGLREGEDVGSIASNRPNTDVIPFLEANKRSGAGGVGVSYSSFSKNYEGTFSSQRQELSESNAHYEILWQDLVDTFCQPVWEDFVAAAMLSGIDAKEDIDPDTLYDAVHSRPPTPWIDPGKEMKGIAQELKLEISSKDEVIRRRGKDPDAVRRQIQLEKQQAAEDAEKFAPQIEKDQDIDNPQESEDDSDDEGADDGQTE